MLYRLNPHLWTLWLNIVYIQTNGYIALLRSLGSIEEIQCPTYLLVHYARGEPWAPLWLERRVFDPWHQYVAEDLAHDIGSRRRYHMATPKKPLIKGFLGVAMWYLPNPVPLLLQSSILRSCSGCCFWNGCNTTGLGTLKTGWTVPTKISLTSARPRSSTTANHLSYRIMLLSLKLFDDWEEKWNTMRDQWIHFSTRIEIVLNLSGWKVLYD